MGFWEIYLFVVLGIAFSVVLPILRKALPKPKAGMEFAGQDFLQRIGPIAEPYVILMIFSLFAGALVVAISGEALADWGKALLAGFTWDSILQKAAGK